MFTGSAVERDVRPTKIEVAIFVTGKLIFLSSLFLPLALFSSALFLLFSLLQAFIVVPSYARQVFPPIFGNENGSRPTGSSQRDGSTLAGWTRIS